MSTHRLKVRLDTNGRPEWHGISEWDMHYPGSRLRYPRSRVTRLRDEKAARRWARRYGVEFIAIPSVAL